MKSEQWTSFVFPKWLQIQNSVYWLEVKAQPNSHNWFGWHWKCFSKPEFQIDQSSLYITNLYEGQKLNSVSYVIWRIKVWVIKVLTYNHMAGYIQSIPYTVLRKEKSFWDWHHSYSFLIPELGLTGQLCLVDIKVVTESLGIWLVGTKHFLTLSKCDSFHDKDKLQSEDAVYSLPIENVLFCDVYKHKTWFQEFTEEWQSINLLDITLKLE